MCSFLSWRRGHEKQLRFKKQEMYRICRDWDLSNRGIRILCVYLVNASRRLTPGHPFPSWHPVPNFCGRRPYKSRSISEHLRGVYRHLILQLRPLQ